MKGKDDNFVDLDEGTQLQPLHNNRKEKFTSYVLDIKEKFGWREVSGALGDLGTLLPILVSLSITNKISLTSSLIFGGLWNILSGSYFKMPICVQPMKAIAAIALTSGMTIGEVMAAGMGVAAVISFLGIIQAMTFIQKYTPDAIIKGIQLGTGLSLMTKAADLVNQSPTWGGSSWNWSDNYEWAILSFIFVFFFYMTETRVPTALILFVVGLILAGIKLGLSTPNGTQRPHIWIYYPTPIVPTWDDFKNSFMTASLGQIPLTALNSVIALAALAKTLFPDLKADTTHIAISIGVMNLSGCFFGSVPYCHGSGGLAAQYRFGARSGFSVILLGICKIFVGFIFGDSLNSLLNYFPKSILGVMLFIAGVELASVIRKLNEGEEDQDKIFINFVILVVTAGMLVSFKNDAIGFIGGCVVALLLWFQNKYIGKRREPLPCPCFPK